MLVMKKDIQKTFFKAFQFGGVVDNCIDIIKERYDLGVNSKSTPEHGKEQTVADEKWRHYYETTLPNRIIKETEDFEKSVINGIPSPIIEEIEENLKECKTDAEIERYIFSLLKPFKGLSDIFCPKAMIERLKQDIEECKVDIQSWHQCTDKKQAKEQIDACEWVIDRHTKDIDRIYYINRQFCEILNDTHERGIIEKCLGTFCGVARRFANQLDALLLTHGIDLMKLQEESGIYLKSHRVITDVDFYIGSIELAQKYINELKNTNIELTNSSTTEKDLPTKDIQNNSSLFEVHISDTILKLHKFCLNDVFSERIADHDFLKYVKTADFSIINSDFNIRKAKLKYIIYSLSKLINDSEWYRNAAASVGVEPKGCSSKSTSVPIEWKEKVDKIIETAKK